jgi:hypothetical protein
MKEIADHWLSHDWKLTRLLLAHNKTHKGTITSRSEEPMTADLHYDQGWFKWPANLLSDLSRSCAGEWVPSQSTVSFVVSYPTVDLHLIYTGRATGY